MTAVVSLPEQKVIMQGVSWETYERLLAEHQDSSGTHFTFNNGDLEIMVLSYEHEKVKEIIALSVNVIAEEFDIDIEGAGSTTFRRHDLAKGFEPDACFYIHEPERIRGKKKIDLKKDPPPDLVIEVDITSPSLEKLPIFAAIGVLEVWRYDGSELTIHLLKSGKYIKQKESLLLSGVKDKDILHFIKESQSLTRPKWLRLVRNRAQKLKKA